MKNGTMGLIIVQFEDIHILDGVRGACVGRLECELFMAGCEVLCGVVRAGVGGAA